MKELFYCKVHRNFHLTDDFRNSVPDFLIRLDEKFFKLMKPRGFNSKYSFVIKKNLSDEEKPLLKELETQMVLELI